MKTAKDMALQKGDRVTISPKNGNDLKCIVNSTPKPDSVYCEVVPIQQQPNQIEVILVHIRFLKIG